MIATADYEALTTGAGLVDRSSRGKLLIQGGEAAEFLQGQVTNDVEALEPGRGCYAAMLNHKGKFRTDMRILRTDEGFWMDTEPIGLIPARWTVETYAIGRDVQQEDVTERMAILSILGPAASDALDVAPGETEHDHVRGEHGRYVATHLGVDVICEAAAADGVRAALGLPEVDEAVAECVRIESGRPRLGYDMDGDTIPQEAGVNERAVDFEKGCYVGQETVARLHWRGKPNRHLRGLRLSEPVERGTDLRLGEKVVARVGSVCVSPVHGPIALALVRREAGPGDQLAAGDGDATATVVDLPFSHP